MSHGERRRRRSSRVLSASVVAVLAAGTLSACGGSSLPVMSSSPTVSAAGKHYSYSAEQVPRSQWPSPCSLLTESSAAAAIDTTVSVRRFHTNCYYTPGSNAYPTLTITLLAVGTGSASSYRRTSTITNKGLDRTSVAGVGRSAYLHPVRHLPAYRINVLTRYAHFAVTEQSPVGQRLQFAQARELLTTVAKVVAKAFG